MDSAANVTSLDAVRRMRTALLQYDEESREAITALVLEVRKAVDWIENDRLRYWPAQTRRAGERLTQARNDLERCELTFGSDDKPSCYEQKRALERAKRRLRLCEEKVRRTKKWVRTVRQEVSEFEGQLARMQNCLDNDMPRAVAALQRMVRALEKYTATRQAGVAAAEPLDVIIGTAEPVEPAKEAEKEDRDESETGGAPR